MFMVCAFACVCRRTKNSKSMAVPLSTAASCGLGSNLRKLTINTMKTTLCFVWVVVLCGMVLLSSGCKKGQRGDFTAFFVDRMLAHGATLSNTNGLPRIIARWAFDEDANGFQRVVFGVGFTEVERMVTNALGTAGMYNDETTGATARCRLFNARMIGVGLLMMEVEGGVQTNCITRGLFWTA